MKPQDSVEHAGRHGSLLAGLGVSVALHLVLLLSPLAQHVRQVQPAAQRLQISLIRPTPPAAAMPAPALPQFAHTGREDRSPSPPPAAPRLPRRQGEGKREARGEAEPAAIAPAPSIDLDQARRIARDAAASMQAKRSGSFLRKESVDTALARRLQPNAESSGGTASHNQSPEARLARSLRHTPTAEVRMTDGTVVMRFAGGGCVIVPPDLPSWRRNAFDATVIMPTNCPGSLSF